MDKNSFDLYQHLWAKSDPYKQLLAHMIDAGCCAYQYLSAQSSRSVLSFLMRQWQCTDEEAKSFAAYLAAMHDIGKAMPQFQRLSESQQMRMNERGMESLLSENTGDIIQHEYFSARIARRIWKGREIPRSLSTAYSCVLSLHHQRLERDKHHPGISDTWMLMQNQLEEEVRAAFNPPDLFPQPQNMDALCILLTGLIVLCDWVASSGPFNALPEVENDYLQQSMEIAERTLEQYRLTGDVEKQEITSFQSLWPTIASPRSIQRCCETLDTHAPLTIIEAPMGEGKTEAALYLAERICQDMDKRGVYVALPTQATSNQMYTRVESMLDQIQGGHVRLLHGTAFLQLGEKKIQSNGDPGESMEAQRWLGSMRMGLLDENGVGTVDQAMAAVLRIRFSILRILGLAGKVLIVDELHAYDAYMSEIIRILLQWCKELEIPVILLSATLQNSQRNVYLSTYLTEETGYNLSPEYPLITQVNEAGKIIQIPTEATMHTAYEFIPEPMGDNIEAIARYAIEQVKSGGCYCVLVNTVNKAQAIYKTLRDLKNEETETMLFHARFTMGRRSEIEKECLKAFGRGDGSKRPEKMILVATQVVEQSLDIDFDGMLTELAPIDLLLQRAGRVHRHRNRSRPSGMEKPLIHVIVPDENSTNDLEKRYGTTGYVYAPFLLNNTERLIEGGIRIRVPDDVRAVISEVYDHITPENLKAWQERAFSQQLMQANATGAAFPEPHDDYFFPSESHPEFSRMDVDDGMEPGVRATTRLGDPTFRIAFVTPTLVQDAQKGKLTGEQCKEIFLASVSLPMRRITFQELENSALYRMEKGLLRGCYLSDNCDIIQVGKYQITNDDTLGIIWEAI